MKPRKIRLVHLVWIMACLTIGFVTRYQSSVTPPTSSPPYHPTSATTRGSTRGTQKAVPATQRPIADVDTIIDETSPPEGEDDNNNNNRKNDGAATLDSQQPCTQTSKSDPIIIKYDASMSVLPGVRIHRNVCLKQIEDRLETYPYDKSSGLDLSPENAYIFRDVCALGHTPKDTAHLYTFAKVTQIPISHFIFGHRCMTRVRDDRKFAGDVVLKRASVFHGVLKHWIDVLFENNVLQPDSVALTYYEDYTKTNETTLRCYANIFERHERWRWFDTVERAEEFAGLFLAHFDNFHKLPRPKPTIHRKLNILVLRRDEDRHFEELKLVKFLQSKFDAVADVQFAQYDKPPPNKLNKENDIAIPPYEDQIAKFVQSDIVIAAHGAVFSNIAAMRKGTAVIELFPNNFRYYMYEELSRLLGLLYFPFEGSTVVKECCGGRGHPPPPITPQNINGERACKKCDISWTETEMYHLVKNAMSSVWLGYSRRTDIHEFDVRKNTK
eukprot:PhF_6_TR3444/c0_g1_i1/m.5017